MSIRLLTGDCRAMLGTLEEGSVHCVVCSPPYWSLRSYNTPPQVFGGDPACVHEWSGELPGKRSRWGDLSSLSAKQASNGGSEAMVAALEAPGGALCASCGAWRGELGLEPTLDLYVEHLVEVFGAVRRVMHPSGLLFVNLGDSYAGSGQGGEGPPRARTETRAPLAKAVNRNRSSDLPPGSLCMVPARFALAMQGDGWLLRSAIVLPKVNPMPESCNGVRWERCRVKVGNKPPTGAQWQQRTYGEGNHREVVYEDCPGCSKCAENDGLVLRWGSGRPTSAYKYLFVFARTSRYFWNTEAGRLPYSPATLPEVKEEYNGQALKDFASAGAQNASDVKRRVIEGMERNGGANMRNWVLWKPSGGLKENHFAAFPAWLPELAIKVGTAEQVCSKCGGPWAPVVEREANAEGILGRGNGRHPWDFNPEAKGRHVDPVRRTLAHRPTCACNAPPRPALVCDPFAGSGTTGLAADRLGRDAILIDLNPTYTAMAEKRATQDAGLFAEVEREEPRPSLPFDAPPPPLPLAGLEIEP
jgi:DNA modification methylase